MYKGLRVNFYRFFPKLSHPLHIQENIAFNRISTWISGLSLIMEYNFFHYFFIEAAGEWVRSVSRESLPDNATAPKRIESPSSSRDVDFSNSEADPWWWILTLTMALLIWIRSLDPSYCSFHFSVQTISSHVGCKVRSLRA